MLMYGNGGNDHDKRNSRICNSKDKRIDGSPQLQQRSKRCSPSLVKCSRDGKKYIAELEADITTIDGLIAFAGSDAGKSVFGADVAPKVVEQAKAAKANGAVYCFCDACKAAEAILSKKSELL